MESRYLPTDKQIEDMLFVHTVESCLGMKNEIMMFTESNVAQDYVKQNKARLRQIFLFYA